MHLDQTPSFMKRETNHLFSFHVLKCKCLDFYFTLLVIESFGLLSHLMTEGVEKGKCRNVFQIIHSLNPYGYSFGYMEILFATKTPLENIVLKALRSKVSIKLKIEKNITVKIFEHFVVNFLVLPIWKSGPGPFQSSPWKNKDNNSLSK